MRSRDEKLMIVQTYNCCQTVNERPRENFDEAVGKAPCQLSFALPPTFTATT